MYLSVDLYTDLSVNLSAGLPPPALSISQDEFVRLEGERFEVTCLTSNPSHHYHLTWTHPNIQVRSQMSLVNKLY